jgi:TonB family protein
MQIVQINGLDYALVLTPLPRPGAVNFKVGVVEENDMKKIKNVLLDTEIVLPDGEVAMLGFRDSREHSYFIAFYVQGRNEEFSKDAVRISGSKRPKMTKRVNPVYPAAALEKKIEGVVVLEAVSDEYGKVKTARVISSPDPLLTEAALQAVKQWEYEPFIKDGKPKGVIFTATVSFSLDPEAKTKKPDNALTRLEDSQRPRLIKRVNPIYPAAAQGKKIEGPVVMETEIDETGKVRAIRILNTPNQLLNDAALTAVKQWVYEPFIKDGKAKRVVFTVTVTFSLHKD